MCNKPGHNHLWKHCPDNSYQKKETTDENSLRCEEIIKEKEHDNDDNTQINNNFSMSEHNYG